jgi:hypothetical protein
MCQVYGPVHLLRLLTKLGPILTASDMDQYVSSDLLFPYFQCSGSGSTGYTCFWASQSITQSINLGSVDLRIRDLTPEFKVLEFYKHNQFCVFHTNSLDFFM